MADYIDREKTIKEVERLEMKGGNDDLTLIDSVEVFDLLFSLTAEEVAPIKHGKWIYEEYNDYPRCNSCKKFSFTETKFCCNCGAKMDLESRE